MNTCALCGKEADGQWAMHMHRYECEALKGIAGHGKMKPLFVWNGRNSHTCEHPGCTNGAQIERSCGERGWQVTRVCVEHARSRKSSRQMHGCAMFAAASLGYKVF